MAEINIRKLSIKFVLSANSFANLCKQELIWQCDKHTKTQNTSIHKVYFLKMKDQIVQI